MAAHQRPLPGVGDPHRLVQVRRRLGEVVAPRVRLADQRHQRAAPVAVRAVLQPLLCPRDRRRRVAPAHGLVRRPRVPPERAGRLPRALEVLRQHHRVALACALEPLGREPVPRRAVRVREHRVRRLAHQRVAEAELGLVPEALLPRPRDDLLLGQVLQPALHVPAADERRHAALVERLPEHARRAEHAPRLHVEPLEARLHHREHRLGQGGLLLRPGLGRGADQLLQVERVPVGAVHDGLHRRVVNALAEHLPDEPLPRLAPQLAEVDPRDVAPGPEPREDLAHLRPGEREHHERLGAEVLERGVDELHRRQVAPLQVLEHQDDGPRRALGAEELLERPADLLAEAHRVEARGARGGLGREGHAHHLAEHRRHALALARPVPEHPRAELALPDVERLAIADAARAAEGVREHPERRAGAHRVALAEEQLRPTPLVAQPAEDLVPEPRLSHPRRRRHHHRARQSLLHAARERRREQRHLVLPPHARRRLAEQRPLHVELVPLSAEDLPAARAGREVEAQGEQPAHHVVDDDRAALRVEQAHGPLDHLAHRQPRRDAAARDDGERRPGHELAHAERTARRPRGEVGRRARARHGDEPHPVREDLDPRLVARDRCACGARVSAWWRFPEDEAHDPPLRRRDLE